MTSNILLDDVDSAISNLALMKASGYHLARGDRTFLATHRVSRSVVRRSFPLEMPEPNVAYVSCVFGWNRPSAELLAAGLERRGASVLRGGTGFDVGPEGKFPTPGTWSRMPEGIEEAEPDYGLYGYDYAVGFCRRGCNRSCEFCVVPRKEGRISRGLSMPGEWVPDGFRKAMLLDNDLALYDPAEQRRILEWFRDHGVRHCITQGYDAREVAKNPGLAGILADSKPWDGSFDHRRIYMAWDYLAIEPQVRAAIRALVAAGFSSREITVYTIIGHRSTHLDDLHRADVLWRELGVYPFAMVFNDRRDDPFLRHFARWVNRPGLLKTIRWEEYEYAGFSAREHAKTCLSCRTRSVPLPPGG